jgi:hypothetical protein
MSGWIGVDLDGTLAIHEEGQWKGVSHIGEPIAPMVERVKQWLAEGIEVRIFTARVAGHGLIENGKKLDAITPIQKWCKKHIGQVLPITNVKDFRMWQLWDDRARQVVFNTGVPVGGDK